MKIGDVSVKLGIPASTIRYYEQVGLISPQPRVSGCRVFDKRALFDLEFVKLSQSAGFTIEETKSLLCSYADDPSPSGMWKTLAKSKQKSILEKMNALDQMNRVLSALLSCKCSTLAECVEKSIDYRRGQKNDRC